MQSTLESKNSAQFTRLVSFDPATGNTAMYGYPIDIASYRKAKDAKIGNIVAVDNQCTLSLTGKPVNTGIKLLLLEKPESLSELWVLTLPEPLR